MHCRWAVTLRPVARNSSVSSSGVFIGDQLITNDCFSTIIVDTTGEPSAGPAARTGRCRRHGAPFTCGRLWPCPTAPALPSRRPAGSTGHEALARLAAEQFDVLVIGGGITGAGVALDAASRGLRTALVEKDDFASGTSSKSSKLVHGGLRYLQQHEFRLVYETLAERQRLLDNAPHLVSPLPFLIPLFGRDGVVNRSVARVYRDRPVALRPDRRDADRPAPRQVDPGRGAGPLADPAHRPAGGRLPLLGRPGRRRPADPDRAPHRGSTTARWWPTTHAVDRASTTGPGRPGAPAAAGDAPDGDGEPFDDPGLGGGERHRGVGRRGPRPRRADATRTRSGRPRASTSPCPSRLPCDIAAVIPVPEDRRSIFVVPWRGDQVYLGTTDTD